ncbi:MAG TPA: YsnF/AvaK domain-containing protein [Bryobacteraceae bacterium]
MATKTQATLVAIFRDALSANNAVEELKANGFTSSDIHVSSEEPAYTTEEPHRRAGGIKGWFSSLFGKGNDEYRTHYEDMLQSGNVLVGIDATGEDVDRAVDILNGYSPMEVRPAETPSMEYTPGTTTGQTTGETRSIPVVEEELKVGKRAVLRGGVRVYSRTVEEPVEENINLQQEHVRVERQPANRPADESDFHAGEQEIEVKEYAEEPVVSKEARVVEDVRIGKDTDQRTETIRDTVRHTETDVEDVAESERLRGSKKNQPGR